MTARPTRWIVPVLLLAAAVISVAVFGPGDAPRRPAPGEVAGGESSPAQVERGRYLAQMGNCTGCHTAPGGEPFAGGLALETPFGTFHTPNITPDPESGIGDWSRQAFRDALLRGERADGAPLYPACPYPSFTHARAGDIDALYAYLNTRAPVRHETRAHKLDFPYGFRPLVDAWQWLWFEPGPLEAAPEEAPEWRRGRYLVEGLGHCNECHRERGTFGAVREEIEAPGGMVHGWYAPSLNSAAEAGLQDWSLEDAAAFLRDGQRNDRAMLGPMAGVVFDSLQHLRPEDARAMATYLRALPETEIAHEGYRSSPSAETVKDMMARGGLLYERHCADCHGKSGQGEEGIVPLAGNRAVTMAEPAPIVRMIRSGGFPASTERHPYPHGMPPFPQLDDPDIAALATYIRQSWGNEAAPVSTIDFSE